MSRHGRYYTWLSAYIRGECADEQVRELEQAFQRDPELLEAYETMKTAQELLTRPVRSDHPAWNRMEQNLLRQWRLEQAGKIKKPEPRPSLAGWGFSLAGAVAMLVFVLWFSVHESKPGVDSADRVAKVEQAVKAPRSFSPLTVLSRVGEEEIHLSERGQGPISAGDSLRTRRDGALKVALGEAIQLTVYPDTSVVFENHEGVLLPRLLRGRVIAEVTPGKTKGFGILTENAMAMVKGTRFMVSHHKGASTVAVERGLVHVRDRHHPGKAYDVGVQKQVSVDTKGLHEPSPFNDITRSILEQKKTLFTLNTEPKPKPAPVPVKPSPVVKSRTPSNPDPQQTDTRTVVRLENELTPQESYDRKLESLSPAERVAYDKFFRFIETKRQGGYTLRAAQELEQYVDSHKDFTSERALFLLAECYGDLQEWEEARRVYRRYMMLHPEGAWYGAVLERLRAIPEED